MSEENHPEPLEPSYSERTPSPVEQPQPNSERTPSPMELFVPYYRAPSPMHSGHVDGMRNEHVERDDDGSEFMECSEPPPANGMRSAPESPAPHSNPASPDAQSSPESPTQDEGQVSDNDEHIEYQNYTLTDHLHGNNPLSEAENVENQAAEDEGDDEEHGRLDKLKDLRFKRLNAQKNARRPGEPTRKTVRSYLDEKGADELDVTAFAARPAKSEPFRDDNREERSERKKKKKRHEDRPHKSEPMDHVENSEPVDPVATESRPVTYSQGGNITQKVHILLTKMEESSAGNGEGESEDDVRALLLEAVFLEQELDATLEKRENLMKEMESMAEKEKENIKKMHSELPVHLQGVIKVEGDNITISDGPNGAALPPPMFPTMPSLLMDGGSGPFPHIPATMRPFGGSNGIALFSGIPNGNRTPPQDDANDENGEEGRRGFSPSMDHLSWSQTFYSTYGSQNDKHFDDLPSYIQDVSSASITFAMPPLNTFIDTDGEDTTQPYQLPPNPGAPGVSDLSRTLTNIITSMVINNPGVNPQHNFGSPSQGQMGAAANSLMSGGVSSPRRNESKPNPPRYPDSSVAVAMYHHPFCPPEVMDLIQQGMLVPIIPPNNRMMRYPPFPVHLGLPMMHAMATRNAAAACPGEGPPQMRKLFIGGLSHETTDEQLRTYFSQWGPVVDAIVIRDQTTKQSRGFGFVTFATINSAEAAMLDRPHVIGGKTVDSKRAIPREQMAPMMPPPFFECDPAPGCKLLLSGIHWDFHTVEALRLYFEKFGSLDQIEGNPRGVGFVIYEDKDSADKCLAHNGGRHIVNDRKVEVRRPMPSQTYWRRPRPQLPLFDQMAGMTLEDTNKVETFEDESNYEGTTTEDDCKSSEHSSSALDTDSPSSNQSQ